jgi:hypothetical protein
MTEFEKMPDTIQDDEEESVTQEEVHSGEQESHIEQMQRESVAIGNAITGPVGIWRKTRYGTWILSLARH